MLFKIKSTIGHLWFNNFFLFIHNFIKNNSSLSLIFYRVSKAIDASTIGTLLEITGKTRDFWDTLRIRPPLFVDVHAYAWACMCVCVMCVMCEWCAIDVTVIRRKWVSRAFRVTVSFAAVSARFFSTASRVRSYFTRADSASSFVWGWRHDKPEGSRISVTNTISSTLLLLLLFFFH